MASVKKTAGKKVAKPTAAHAATPKSRRIKRSNYKSFKLSKRIRHPHALPGAWQIARRAWRLLWQHKKVIIGITLVYGILNLILVRGFSGGTDVGSLKDTLNQIFNGNWGHFASSLTIFALLVTSAGNNSSGTAGAYQALLLIIVSLAVVWTFRQLMAGEKVRVRDGFYRGMYPLIPAILVLCVIGLQLIPLLIGSTLYSTVVNNAIAVYAVEKFFWGLLFFLLALLSLYMLCSSIFALYIVTLPDMTPMKALRSARELVRHRRWTILRKIIFLPIILLIVAAIIMVPIIAFATPVAQWVFFVLTMFALAAVHAYMYTLYRDML
jgi:hypothetical protein